MMDSKSPERCCSICLDPVVRRGGQRSVARLHCGHDFHLDCIGSAFNAKGQMQCPNCRTVEKGQWLYANGEQNPSNDFDLENFIGEEFYDLATIPELPVFHWCPFRGFTQLTPVNAERDPPRFAYYDLLGSSSAMPADLSVGTSGQHEYMAQHSMHASSSSSAPMDTNTVTYRQFPGTSNGYGMPPRGMDLIPMHLFPTSDATNFRANTDQPSTSQYNRNRNNNESSALQRLAPYLQPVPLFHGPMSRGGNSVGTSMGPPSLIHARNTNMSGNGNGTITGTGTSSGTGHQYQHRNNVNPPPHVAAPVPVRRVRPRSITFFPPASSTVSASTSSNTADVGGFYGNTLGVRSSGLDGDGPGLRHMDRVYAPPRSELTAPLPWIPLEGESQWWGPFNPAQNGRTGGVFSQRGNGEHQHRDPQRRSDNSNSNSSNNGHHHHLASQHNRPPYM